MDAITRAAGPCNGFNQFPVRTSAIDADFDLVINLFAYLAASDLNGTYLGEGLTKFAVIPAQAGIHFDFCGMSGGDQDGSQLSLG